MKILTETNTRLIGLAILILRCAVGVIFFMGGSGKMLGWFGGIGPEITINFYSGMGFSKFVAYLSSYTEFIGGFLLIVGLLTRLAVCPGNQHGCCVHSHIAPWISYTYGSIITIHFHDLCSGIVVDRVYAI